jgi:signal recognition particle GTPase
MVNLLSIAFRKGDFLERLAKDSVTDRDVQNAAEELHKVLLEAGVSGEVSLWVVRTLSDRTLVDRVVSERNSEMRMITFWSAVTVALDSNRHHDATVDQWVEENKTIAEANSQAIGKCFPPYKDRNGRDSHSGTN